jgi:hypothetical protein
MRSLAGCRCRGRDNLCDAHWQDDVEARCEASATREDLLCDKCRQHGCVRYETCLTCWLWADDGRPAPRRVSA